MRMRESERVLLPAYEPMRKEPLRSAPLGPDLVMSKVCNCFIPLTVLKGMEDRQQIQTSGKKMLTWPSNAIAPVAVVLTPMLLFTKL